MYDKSDKKFHCDNCNKVVEPGEVTWVKWRFPADHKTSQYMPSKVFELDNSPIICKACSNKDIKFSDF